MEVIIPIGTTVRLHGNSTLFRVSDKFNTSAVSKYQLTNLLSGQMQLGDVTATDLVIINNRALYKKIIKQQVSNKEELVKSVNKEITICKSVLDELEKFSSDETELLDIIEKFKTEEPSEIQRLLTCKDHIDFSKFLGEWA